MSEAAHGAADAAALTDPAPVVVVMGVSGSGKTTLGQALSARHGFRFLDADDFHSSGNVAKMRAGLALDDADRVPWLERLAGLLAEAREPTVLACSALKARYREVLVSRCPQALFVHLAGSRELIGARLTARTDHYMPPSLLNSQMSALEAPGEDGASITLRCDQPVDHLCGAVLSAIAVRRKTASPGGRSKAYPAR